MNKVVELLIAKNAKELLFNIKKISVVKDRGIVGDRYYNKTGSFSEKLKEKEDFHVTLIEKEEIEKFNEITGYDYASNIFRRNIVTQGIRLNELVGKRFEINNVQFLGMRLCEPCKMLSDMIGDEFLTKMVHKAGLRAKVLSSGEITLGNKIKSF